MTNNKEKLEMDVQCPCETKSCFPQREYKTQVKNIFNKTVAHKSETAVTKLEQHPNTNNAQRIVSYT